MSAGGVPTSSSTLPRAHPTASRLRGQRASTSSLDQTILERIAGQLRPAVETELLLHMGAMGLDSSDAERELLCDFGIGVTEGHQPQNLGLAWRERQTLAHACVVLEAGGQRRWQVLTALGGVPHGFDQLQVRRVLEQVAASPGVDRPAGESE